MKKYISLLSILILLGACSTKQANKEETNNTQTDMKTEKPALENKEVIIDDVPALIGEINEDYLKTENYNDWYSFYKEDYPVNKEVVQSFKKDVKDFDITLFIGTWCEDSHDKGPAFIKIMEEAGYPIDKIQMFSVDRNKKALNGQEEAFNIGYVPTFIFFKNGQEVGRIVESPINSLEEDIRDIIHGNPQTPNYAE